MSANEKWEVVKGKGWEEETAQVFCCIQAGGERWDKITILSKLSLPLAVCCAWERDSINSFYEFFPHLNFGSPVLLLDGVNLCFLGLIIWEILEFHACGGIPRQRD